MNKTALPLFLLTGFIIAGCSSQPAAPTPEPPAQEIALGPNDISLEIQGLPYRWDAQVVRGTPYDDTQPPGPMGLPAHIQASFTLTDDTATQAHAPVMYIIPVEAYKALWDEAGNAAVSKTTAQILQYASLLSYPGIISGLPVLPFEQVGGTNDLAVQQGRVPANLASATRDGYRFVGRFAQDANPVTNQGLQYIYQGFTNDAEYLVAFFAPVRTGALVNSAGEVAQHEQDQLNVDYSSYMQERAAMLNGLDSTAWQPDLATLDALIASLTINGMAGNAAISFVFRIKGSSVD